MAKERGNRFLRLWLMHLSRYIHSQCGINLTPSKKLMLSTRLNSRLKQLGMKEFNQYFNYLQGDKEDRSEFYKMLDAVTINKTEFFREAEHFNILTDLVLPELLKMSFAKSRNSVNFWSAGCATGEEPYTLAMVLAEFFSKVRVTGFSILATDISSKALATAENAIYKEEAAGSIPVELKEKYLLRGKGPREGFIRISEELRKDVTFKWHNLKVSDFTFSRPIDIIFCRNVMIYFDDETKLDVVKKFHDLLTPGGYLFLGHTESVFRIKDYFNYIAPSVYRKPEV